MNLVDFELNKDELILMPIDHIDSQNAPDMEKKFDEIIAAQPHEKVTIDAKKLNRISSAGLRIVLRLFKRDASLTMVNVSSDVYEIFEMTGFTELFPVSKAYRKVSVAGCEIIGAGAKGTVYRYDDDTIIKVYKDPGILPEIISERGLAKRAFVLGVPTAISFDVVQVGDSYGSMFELVNPQPYSRLILKNLLNRDKYITQFAELLKSLHQIVVKPEDMPDVKLSVFEWYQQVSSYLPRPVAEKLNRMLHEVPNVMTLLHCDFHTNNVMDQDGQAVLIDMATLSHGHPIFDLTHLYVANVGFGELDPTIVEKFLDMPYALTKEIWRKTLAIYLGTDDPERITEVEDKVRIVSYMRLMRHYIRRGAMKTEEGAKTVRFYQTQLESLLERYDTLTF